MTQPANDTRCSANAILQEKQRLLETETIRERMDQMLGWLTGQIEMVGVDKKIRGRVKQQMEKSQREYYLNEQMKAIQKELDNGEDGPSEIEQLQAKVDDAGMSAEAKKKAESEIKKLKMMLRCPLRPPLSGVTSIGC